MSDSQLELKRQEHDFLVSQTVTAIENVLMTASVANVNTGYLPRNPRIGCGVEGKTLSVDVRLVEDMISFFHRQRQIFLEGISRESNWDAIWLELVASPTDTTVASVSDGEKENSSVDDVCVVCRGELLCNCQWCPMCNNLTHQGTCFIDGYCRNCWNDWHGRWR